MKPYYQDGSVTIYLGNCEEVCRNIGRFDLLLTDPPYGIGEDGGACRTRGSSGYSKHRKKGWDANRPSRSSFDLILSIADNHIIWGGNYFSDMLPPKMGWFYWRKLMGGDFSDGELAWTSRDGALREFTKCPKGIDKVHPCQKPIELANWCLAFFPGTKSMVDPYMGSGTFLRAAKDAGIRSVGIEQDEEYCEAAAKRMSQESIFSLLGN